MLFTIEEEIDGSEWKNVRDNAECAETILKYLRQYARKQMEKMRNATDTELPQLRSSVNSVKNVHDELEKLVYPKK